MTPRYDIILAGGGLANGLIAWRLRQQRPELRILLLEQGDRLGGNHTWSFHSGDLTPAQHAWLAPLISHRWDAYSVIFPQRRRRLTGGYLSIASQDFARVIEEDLAGHVRTGSIITRLTPTEVALASGELLEAGAVIDGRGAHTSPHMALGYQAFVGQELRLTEPHGLTEPILMDASVAQGEGYRFVYVLPFSADTLLIEDTHYVDAPVIDAARWRDNIRVYARSRHWSIAEVLREEQGVLPITLAGNFPAFWRAHAGQPVSGLRAGLFHPTTGYSLPHAVRLAERIAAAGDLSAAALSNLIAREAEREWRGQRFFRLLNRMLFLAGQPGDRWKVMQRFYGLAGGLIHRFYAGRLTPLDKLRIVSGKPPVPLVPALRAAGLIHPHQIRTRT